jgi:hypothetical protein
MPFPSPTGLEFFGAALETVVKEFRELYAQMEGWLRAEHTGPGGHSHITTIDIHASSDGWFGGIQGGGLEHDRGNVIVGDQIPIGVNAIRGYGIKCGRWRIVADRDGPAEDLLFQNADLNDQEHLFKFALTDVNQWALQPGLGSQLLTGTLNLPLTSLCTRRAYIGQFGAFIESGTGSPEGLRAAPPGSLWMDVTPPGTLWVKATGTDVTGWVVLGSGGGGATGAAAGPRSVSLVIDGGGSVITTGVKGFTIVPYSGTITKWTLLSTDASVTSGSIVIDVWKRPYTFSYPPTVADSITPSARPTLSTATAAQSSTLTGWSPTVTAGDVFGFSVMSVSTLTKALLVLEVV